MSFHPSVGSNVRMDSQEYPRERTKRPFCTLSAFSSNILLVSHDIRDIPDAPQMLWHLVQEMLESSLVPNSLCNEHRLESWRGVTSYVARLIQTRRRRAPATS